MRGSLKMGMPKFFSFLCLLSTVFGQQNSRPNIILIVADDLGWDDVSFHGSKQIPTPNIDSLANHGIILSNYYVQPICTPTRSALLTARHPIHLGLQSGVITGSSPYGLPLNETIMPQYLNTLGYTSHIVGKWHLGMFAKEYTPTYRGFESHFGYLQGEESYYDHTYGSQKNQDEWGLDFRRNMAVVKDKFGQYSTELFAEEAEAVIENHDTDKPLFLYLPFQAVHSANPITPLEAPWKYRERFDYIKDPNRRLFAAMASAMDDAIGNVIAKLDSKGMLDNSVIVFTTDNGGPAGGYNRNHASNWPLRGVKHTLWEGGLRGAGLVWSPLLKKTGYTSDHMMHVCDILPTVLHAAGYDMTKLPSKLDGMDFWDTLSTNKESPRKEILHNIDPHGSYKAIRSRDMKLIMGSSPDGKKWDGWFPPETLTEDVLPRHKEQGPDSLFEGQIEAIISRITPDKNTKAPFQVVCKDKPKNSSDICYPNKKTLCLFNITADPCEYHDLADKFPGYVDKLLHKLSNYEKTAVPILNKPQDPKGYPKYHNWIWTPWVNLTSGELEEWRYSFRNL